MILGRALLPLWPLRQDIRFLNHGAFGATPLELLEVQRGWRDRMEANPPRFFQSELPELLREAARALAAFVGTAPERLGFVENASTGTAAALGALSLSPGDEIVTTSHVYNALRNALKHVALRTGAVIIEAPVPMPVADGGAFVAAVRSALTERTRAIVVDHIASASAVTLPVAELVALARSAELPIVIDGAHAPGMLELSLDALGADIYVGNCHKWLCAPKGAGFIAVSPEMAGRVHPTVISHAYGQGFAAEFGKIGTRDPTSWLTVPAALAFHERLGGAALRARNIALARRLGGELAAALGTEMGAAPALFGSMATVRLPTTLPAEWPVATRISDALFAAHLIEVPVMALSGALWVRISVQAYNEDDDYGALAAALTDVLRAMEQNA